MTTLALYGLDLVAVTVLTLGVYWRRHRRRDLVAAFFGINVGVLAVSALLANSAVTAGLGLGLFGVLSIIRLRSDELAQHEIAYYFAVLALGLIGGLGVSPLWLSAAFMALIVATMAVIDHPALFAGHRRQVIVVDRAIRDERALREHLEELLAAQVMAFTVLRTDLVSDTTTVDVRFRVPRGDGDGDAMTLGRRDGAEVGTSPVAHRAPAAQFGRFHRQALAGDPDSRSRQAPAEAPVRSDRGSGSAPSHERIPVGAPTGPDVSADRRVGASEDPR